MITDSTIIAMLRPVLRSGDACPNVEKWARTYGITTDHMERLIELARQEGDD